MSVSTGLIRALRLALIIEQADNDSRLGDEDATAGEPQVGYHCSIYFYITS